MIRQLGAGTTARGKWAGIQQARKPYVPQLHEVEGHKG